MFRILCIPRCRATRLDGLLLLFVCLLLSGCAPPPPDHEVRHLTAIGETVYLQTTQVSYNEKEILSSTDGGRNWQEIKKVPVAVTYYFASSPQLPMINCVPSLPRTCYRITGEAQIEQSTDEGESWRVIWASPVARHHFMERFYNTLKPNNCSKSHPNVIPLDLAIADFDQGEHTLVAAMGNEGILVVTPAGEWSRHQIRCANPTPYQLVRWDQALGSIWLETLAFAFILLIANPLYLRVLRANGRRFITVGKLIGVLYLLSLGFLLISAIIGVSRGQRLNDFLFMAIWLHWGPFFLLGNGLPDYMKHPTFWELVMFGSFLLSALQLRSYRHTKSTIEGCLADFIAFLLVNLCFLLWIMGIIPHYGTALILSLVLAGSSWLFGQLIRDWLFD